MIRRKVTNFGNGGRRLAQFLPTSPERVWRARADAHGRRAVLNIGHPEEDYDTVTEHQKAEIYPHFLRSLAGYERTVVDFGCGPGRFTPDLAAMVEGVAVGIDVVPAFLEMAPEARDVSYRRMRRGRAPLPGGFADVVWVCLVLGGLEGGSLQRAIREIDRLLAARGLLFLVENTTDQPDTPHWKFRSVEAYRTLFSAAPLTPLHEYKDLGERITIMAGRKQGETP